MVWYLKSEHFLQHIYEQKKTVVLGGLWSFKPSYVHNFLKLIISKENVCQKMYSRKKCDNLWKTNPGVSFMWVEKSTECNFVWISSNPNNMNYDENILCSQYVLWNNVLDFSECELFPIKILHLNI